MPPFKDRAVVKVSPLKFHYIFLNEMPSADQQPLDSNIHVANKSYADVIDSITTRTNAILEHKIMQDLFHTKDSFDLFIMGYNLNDILLGILLKPQCPAVVISAYPAADPITYYSDDHSGNISKKLSAVQRLIGAMTTAVEYTGYFLLEIFGRHSVQVNLQNQSYVSSSVLNDVTLTYLNQYFQNSGPNIVNIGGIELDGLETSNNLRTV